MSTFDAADWQPPDDWTGVLLSLNGQPLENRTPEPGELAVRIREDGVIEVSEVGREQ